MQDFTFTHIEDHGTRKTVTVPRFSAHDRSVGYMPHVRADILLNDTDIDGVLTASHKSNGGTGHGVYWMTEVLQQGRL
ncbi:MAG: hypothetical protein HY081_02500 [Gammaproteobacteria bacterium]|nr:hypothetical protein [Gammaproteobacteria bacterium]